MQLKDPQTCSSRAGAMPTTDLVKMLTQLQLDRAMDRAARASASTVALFIAAPLELSVTPKFTRIEFAIEFFVPPVSMIEMETELDRGLMYESPAYKTVRRGRQLLPPSIQVIPAGAFHQWRMAWNYEEPLPANERWSSHRQTMDSLLQQIRVGFRELLAV